MNAGLLLSSLRASLGEAAVRTGADAAGRAPSEWSTAPLALVAPSSPESVAEIVRLCEAEGAAIVPTGGGAQLHTGNPPSPDRPYLLLETGRMAEMLDYQPDDMTVTCRPGVTLAALQEALATKGQFLPLDPPLPDTATLGGLVSTNTTGFWRPAYGAPRDLLIGLRAVMTGGVDVKGGGRVVKNVAGYDVCKLFTGAWGTLGILTELTFKVLPRPEMERAVAWEMPGLAAAVGMARDLHQARLALSYALATNEVEGGPRLIVGLRGASKRVDWQADQAARRVIDAGFGSDPVVLSAEQMRALRDRQARNGPADIAARLVCLPSNLLALTARLEALASLDVTIHAATGVVSLGVRNADLAAIHGVRDAVPSGASLVWTRLDPDLAAREQILVWGDTRGEFKLHSALKRSIDPRNTFSPGRFPGGL